MVTKTQKIVYWFLLVLFSGFFLFDAIGGLMQIEAGKQAMIQLGYPMYLMTITGVTKVLGIIGLWQNKFPILKEWAFAGFTINFIGASASWYFSNGPIFNVIFPWIMLAILMIIYSLWKKMPH